MSKFVKVYGQLRMNEITVKWDICSSSNRSRSAANPFPSIVARRVDAFNKITKRTSAPISCWKFTHHHSTMTLFYAQNFD